MHTPRTADRHAPGPNGSKVALILIIKKSAAAYKTPFSQSGDKNKQSGTTAVASPYSIYPLYGSAGHSGNCPLLAGRETVTQVHSGSCSLLAVWETAAQAHSGNCPLLAVCEAVTQAHSGSCPLLAVCEIVIGRL